MDKEVEEVAEALHRVLCNWNHTDGCEYEYGGGNRTRALMRYTARAERMLKENTAETIVSVLKSM